MSANGLTVREMLNLSVMEHSKLVSGERGLDRIIQYVDIWEVPDIDNWLREGVMVLTTGYSTRNEPELLIHLIEQLARVNGAGVCIKPERFIPQIPQEMLDKSNQYNIPVIQLPIGMAYIDITKNVMGQILNRQAILLKRSEEVNKALTSLVLNNKGIQVVADNVSELIQSPVWIVDKAGEARISSPEGYPYAASEGHHYWEINVDNKMLGKLVVEKRELNELDLMLLEQARLVFSLELMRNQIAAVTERRLRGTFFEELILNASSEKSLTASRGRQLGFDPDWIWEVAVMEADDAIGAEALEESALASKLEAFVSKESAGRKVRSHLLTQGNRIVLFLPSFRSGDSAPRTSLQEEKTTWSEALFSQLEEGDAVRIGVGKPCFLFEVQRSYREARTALFIGNRLNRERQLFMYAEVEMLDIVLGSAGHERLDGFVQEKIGVLAEHDKANGTNYVNTLYHYLATGGSLNETAGRLYIHRNSVNYRMDRIKTIAGIDLSNARVRFELYLSAAYHLMKQ